MAIDFHYFHDTFHDVDDNKKAPCMTLLKITIDPVHKSDESYDIQALLEECNYKIKEKTIKQHLAEDFTNFC